MNKSSGIVRNLFGFSLIALLFCFASCNKESDTEPNTPRSLQVWLHRVNTIPKAQLFRTAYTGFELDVHYDTTVRTFIVKHDASDTSTLTLPVWFSAITDPSGLGYWLDFKNLDAFNKDAALAELLKIRNEFGLTKNIIVVESSNPVALIHFDTLNFRTSFYIPCFDPTGLTQEEQQTYADFISSHITESSIKTISGYYIQHGFMNEWFPSMNKLLWYLDSFDPAVKDSIITETRKDQSVEVLLVAENFFKDTGTGK